jgi:hypothetical protein
MNAPALEKGSLKAGPVRQIRRQRVQPEFEFTADSPQIA